MHILHIFENRDSNRASGYAAEVMLGLQQTGIEQCAMIDSRSSWAAELTGAGIKTVSLPSRKPWRPSRRLWVRKLIARLQPDVAHCWTRRASRLLPAVKLPTIGWLAGNDYPRRFVRCTHFVSASRDTAEQLAGNNAFGARSRFIPTFSKVSTVPPFDRSALATSHDAKVLLSLAPLHPASRLEVLLAALKNLPDCVAWFAGEGPLQRQLEEKARHFGVLSRVRFVAARINRDALLRAANISVLMAADRPCGTIIPQSWAAGTPVIASQCAGFAAPLEDAADGLLAPTGDERAFAGAVRRTLDQDPVRRRLIAKGYATYLGVYAREAVIRQWTDFYRQVAARC